MYLQYTPSSKSNLFSKISFMLMQFIFYDFLCIPGRRISHMSPARRILWGLFLQNYANLRIFASYAVCCVRRPRRNLDTRAHGVQGMPRRLPQARQKVGKKIH